MNTFELIKARADLLQKIRSFFSQAGVLEVDTPLLYPCASTDPYIHHISLLQDGRLMFLQSSPEFAMKRLLARCPVSMYQICKAFRAHEEGKKHRSEFTMLEWYMLDYSLEDLRAQCQALLHELLGIKEFTRVTYREAFIKSLSVDPFRASDDELRALVIKQTSALTPESFSKEECLHLLFAEKVEKHFDKNKITFVEAFPANQAALASCSHDEFGNLVANRFEIYLGGLELANAYQEERDAAILQARFEKDNLLRQQQGMPTVPVDQELLSAMTDFPHCAGIAMGVDRVLLQLTGESSLAELSIF